MWSLAYKLGQNRPFKNVAQLATLPEISTLQMWQRVSEVMLDLGVGDSGLFLEDHKECWK